MHSLFVGTMMRVYFKQRTSDLSANQLAHCVFNIPS